MTLWYLSHRWPEKLQVSLRICAVLPEPMVFTHMKYWNQTKKQTSSPSGWLRMRVWRMSLRRMKNTVISLDGSNALSLKYLALVGRKIKKNQTKTEKSTLTNLLRCLKCFDINHKKASLKITWAGAWQNQQYDLCVQRRLRSALASTLSALWVAKDPRSL